MYADYCIRRLELQMDLRRSRKGCIIAFTDFADDWLIFTK
jgi:hypothetical protein